MTEPDDPEAALRAARDLFVAGFSDACDAIARVVSDPEADARAVDIARRQAHRMAGTAGMVGFPAVSACALDLEEALTSRAWDRETVTQLLQRLRDEFSADAARTAPRWARHSG